jgi:hypothetical protein
MLSFNFVGFSLITSELPSEAHRLPRNHMYADSLPPPSHGQVIEDVVFSPSISHLIIED